MEPLPRVATRPDLGEQPPTILLARIPALAQIRLERAQPGPTRRDQRPLRTRLGPQEAAHGIRAHMQFGDDLAHPLALGMQPSTGLEAELAPRLRLGSGTLAWGGVTARPGRAPPAMGVQAATGLGRLGRRVH